MWRKIVVLLPINLALLGCGTSETVVDSHPQTRGKNVEAEPIGQDSETASAITPEEEMNRDVAQLVQKATQLEVLGKDQESLEAWQKIVGRIAAEYGDSAWQVTSARLSLQAAQQRQAFEVADRVKALEINELEQQAEIETLAGKMSVAKQCLESAKTLAEEVWGVESHITLNVAFQLAACYDRGEFYEESFALIEEVVRRRQQVLGSVHPDTLEAVSLAAAVATTLGRFDDAIDFGTEAVEVAELLEGGESLELAKHKSNLGVTLVAAKKYEPALACLESALEMRTRLLGSSTVDVAHSEYNLGQAILAQGDALAAGKRFQKVCDILETFPKERLSLAQAKLQLGTIALMQNDLGMAELEYREAKETVESLPKNNPALVAETCFKLGFVLGKQGEYVAAEAELRRARSIQQELFPSDHPELAKTEEIYLLVQGKLNSIRTGRLPEGVQR